MAGSPRKKLTLACALASEERVARKGGAVVARVGVRASLGVPDGSYVSFGFAGALIAGLPPGTIVTADRVVDSCGDVLWEGAPINIPEGKCAAPVMVETICSSEAIVDAFEERSDLARKSGAAVVDMESGPLARLGCLAGAVRVVVDGPDRPLGKFGGAVTDSGELRWGTVLASFFTEPRETIRLGLAGFKAMKSLEYTACVLAGGV